MSRDLGDVRLAALMVDGIELKGRCCVVALGVSTEGVKLPLGLWDGSTENKTVTAHLLADLVDRGLDVAAGRARGPGRLEGAQSGRRGGLRARPGATLYSSQGTQCPGSSPRARPARRKARLRRAWASENYTLALDGSADPRQRARALPSRRGSVTHRGPGGDSHPHPPGDPRRLKKTLASTNPIESMIEIIRRTSRNVKRWQSGDMCLRWTAAGMLEAETQFRKVIGYTDLAKLALAVERDLLAQRTPIRHHDQGGHAHHRHRVTITPRPPPRTSTANGTTSRQDSVRS